MKILHLKNNLTIFTLLIIVFSTVNLSAFGTTLTVDTDKDAYFPGEHVTISGMANPGESLKITVQTSEVTIFDTTVVVPENGVYAVTFMLIGASTGEYTVEASSSSEDAEVDFRIVDGDCKLAHHLLELLSSSRERTEKMLSELESVETASSHVAFEKFLLAEEKYEEAHELYDEGKCREAAAKATEALRLYGEAVKLYERSEKDEPKEDVEERVEKILELKDILERIYSYLEKVKETASGFEERGLNVDEANSLIEKAIMILEQVRELLEEGKIEDVEENIRDAKEILKESMSLLQIANEESKIERANKFLTETEERLDKMEDRIITMLGNIGVSESVINAVGDVFENAKVGIWEVKLLLKTGEVEKAIDEFEEVFEDAEEGLDLIEDYNDDRADILEVIEKHEARIRYIVEKIESLRDADINVSELILEITDLKGILERAVIHLEKGENDEARRLIVEFEDWIVQIEGRIIRLWKEWRIRIEQREEPKTDTEDKDYVEYVGLLAYIDELEAKIAYLEEKIEALRDKGYDIENLMPYITLARRFLDKIALGLEEDEIEGLHDIILELKDLVVHIENEINVILKTHDVGTEIKEDETCNEEISIETIVDVEELEGKIFYLEEKLEDLARMGCDVSKLEPYLEAARRLLNKILSLDSCEGRLVENILADFEDIFTYITVEADIMLEHATSVGTVNFIELEEKISCLEEMVECLRDKGFDIDHLIPYLHSSRLVLTEMMSLDEHETDLMNKLLEELEDLFVYIENKVDIMLEELGDETCVEIVEVVEEVPVYYIFVVEEEVYGEFEWMVVKDLEGFVLVFEEGQIYDGFIEWMLNVEEGVCELKDGKIYSVDKNNDETLEWVFEGAFPTSWTGPNLDSTSSGPLLIERVELSIVWLLGE